MFDCVLFSLAAAFSRVCVCVLFCDEQRCGGFINAGLCRSLKVCEFQLAVEAEKPVVPRL